MFSVGVVAKITQSVSFSDKSMKVLIKGLQRIRIDRLYEDNSVRYAAGKIMADGKSLKVSEKERLRIIQDLLRWNPGLALTDDLGQLKSLLKENDGAKFVSRVLALTSSQPKPSRFMVSIAKKKKPPFSKAELERINLEIAQRQRVLEEPRLKPQLALISETLNAETIRALQQLR